MPEKRTIKAARRDLRRGKSPRTAAGKFIREEIHHIREGKHGARSAKQAIAIGLSKARRAGIPVPPGGPPATRKKAARDLRRAGRKPSKRRSRAALQALKRAPRRAASREALSRQARSAARARARRGK